jgi:porphobilinogen deaminase
MATKQDRTYAEAVAAARAAMQRTREWYLTDASHDYRTHGPATAQEIAAAARSQGWSAAANTLAQLPVSKTTMRALIDRVCAEVGCDPHTPLASPIPAEVAEAFAELQRREANLASFRTLRSKLEAA